LDANMEEVYQHHKNSYDPFCKAGNTQDIEDGCHEPDLNLWLQYGTYDIAIQFSLVE